MKYLPLFLCFIFYACNVNDTNVDNSVDRVYSPTTMPDCPSLVPSIPNYEPQYDDNGELILLPDGSCGLQVPFKDTLYFRKQGGFECLILMGGGPMPLMSYATSYRSNNYFDNDTGDECKPSLASYSYLDNHNVISVPSDYCKNNYCYESPGIFSDPSSAPVMKRECSWHSVAHTSKESLLISVDKNENGKERSIYVRLGTLCDFRVLTIIQSSE